MLPTEDFGVKETVAFARCRFGACLPSDLCVLVSEGNMLRRPGVVEGIQVKGRIKSIVGGLGVVGLGGRNYHNRNRLFPNCNNHSCLQSSFSSSWLSFYCVSSCLI